MEALMLTPQAIKDQEFQVKFRGYDTIEVKSYLELLAEDFFELLEQNRFHTEEIKSLVAEQELLQVEKEKFENELQVGQVSRAEIEAEIREESRQQDEQSRNLEEQIEELNTTVTQLEDENAAYREKIAELEAKLSSEGDAKTKEQNEIGRLQNKLEQVEKRKRELEEEELDFKTTILAAQKFSENLKENSEIEARSMLEQAKLEVEKIRNEAREELIQLPKKIEELQQRKIQVHNELKALLHKYMEGLEAPPGTDADTSGEDLFQRILIPDGESVDLDDGSINAKSS